MLHAVLSGAQVSCERNVPASGMFSWILLNQAPRTPFKSINKCNQPTLYRPTLSQPLGHSFRAERAQSTFLGIKSPNSAFLHENGASSTMA